MVGCALGYFFSEAVARVVGFGEVYRSNLLFQDLNNVLVCTYCRLKPEKGVFDKRRSYINSFFKATTGYVYLPVATRRICIPICSISVLLYLRYRIVYWSPLIKEISDLVRPVSANMAFCLCYRKGQFTHPYKAGLYHFENCINVEICDQEKLILHNILENVFYNWQAIPLCPRA